MSEFTLNAKKRTVIGKQVKTLRNEGLLPAIIFGKGIEPLPITLDLKTTTKILRRATSSSLIEIEVEGVEKFSALVRDTQYNFLKGNILHIDFQSVSLTELIRSQVPLNIVGESPAVESNLVVLVVELQEIEVEGLPQNLPSSIDVDISELVEGGMSITVGDIVIPEGVVAVTDPTATIALVTWQTIEEEEEEVDEDELEDFEPEVVDKGKREDEE